MCMHLAFFVDLSFFMQGKVKGILDSDFQLISQRNSNEFYSPSDKSSHASSLAFSSGHIQQSCLLLWSALHLNIICMQ